jgi:predicted dienelactone hydrolase
MKTLTAGPPLEPPHFPVGRRTFSLVDAVRGGRRLAVDLWYPAAPSDAQPSIYQVFPGVEFAGATAQHDAPALGGPFPLILLSHGRTGMRLSYSLVCEALAARGAIVVSADHPGDTLFDWLTGTQTDDRTNEVDRVADAHLVLDAVLDGHVEVAADVSAAIDHGRVALAGHSYGAYTAFAVAAGTRGVAPHPEVRAVIGFQPYTRSMSDALLARITAPTLLIVSELDQVTPAAVDTDRPWALLGGPTWRVDFAGAGHQAISDIALYAELADHVADLPDLVREYLRFTAMGTQQAHGRGWRAVEQLEVAAVWAFLQIALDIDVAAGDAAARALATLDGLSLQQR